MAVEEELGGPAAITAVSWMRTGEGDDRGIYRDVTLHMGLTDLQDLTAFFEQNYTDGTRTLVFSRDSLYLQGAPGEWVTLLLDQPFDYPGTGNLILELRRDGYFEDTYLFTYRWYTPEYRTVSSDDPDSETGVPDDVSSMLMLEYESGLSALSWPAIKCLCTIP